ncbi:MAG: glycosyl hydrolase, partial [Tannerella sp.]|nr:glycosyl hydrolase [Tannerella sp.]
MTSFHAKTLLLFLCLLTVMGCTAPVSRSNDLQTLKEAFLSPPDASRPGVYWYFMDGNLSKEGITADLESMKEAGIGNVLFLEVNVGVPRGKVDFLSEEWQDLFAHAVAEAKRLGIELTLGSGPGWAGSGGPWVKPEQSMRHLVASETTVQGPSVFHGTLPVPAPKPPYFGEGALTPQLKQLWNDYFEDVCVLACPAPEKKAEIADIDEKALIYRAPYTSVPGVKPFLPTSAAYEDIPGASIDPNRIIDLTAQRGTDGQLHWEVPAGNWIILRFGMRNNGAVTRPAPMPGLGFEVDKFDTTAFNAHFDAYMGKLLDKAGRPTPGATGGWTMIHIDSWEMGAQNWTDHFREEFIKRRSYDPLKYLPVYAGKIVDNLETSERFLWDVRQIGMELVLENHALHFKHLGERNGLTLSIEPYDMNPTADLDLGAVADVPMCEFWTEGHGFNSAFSCIEATSIAHVYGRPVVGAESFTADHAEAWTMYPENVKNQGDWAFCMGINKFVYHTFAHKPLGEAYRPGMTMGPYGVHWDRGQTWWPMASAYHRYVTRCQHVLRQGRSVAEILYLTPEGAPHVFRPPASALDGTEIMPDKRGYNFDGCSPRALIEMADVAERRIVFPGGASYRVLVLPDIETMTPALLQKIESLVKKGATVIGRPPVKSPGLVNYPDCDREIKDGVVQIWGSSEIPEKETNVNYGDGQLFWGGKYAKAPNEELYPDYKVVADLLNRSGVKEDFVSKTGGIRYTHRITGNTDIYFISNKTGKAIEDICTFRSAAGAPELWNPVTGEIRPLTTYTVENGQTSIPFRFDKSQSYFIVFDPSNVIRKGKTASRPNFPEAKEKTALDGSWEVSFDPERGGPATVRFETLSDWSRHTDEGIRYYSGKATYVKTFDLPASSGDGASQWYIDLGKVKNIARITLNGHALGILWTSPWRVNITGAMQTTGNRLEIEVVNLWPNRLIGDEQLPDDGIKDGKWPDWLLNHTPRTSGRYTFTTHRYYKKDSPLLESGLIGPVRIVAE